MSFSQRFFKAMFTQMRLVTCNIRVTMTKSHTHATIKVQHVCHKVSVQNRFEPGLMECKASMLTCRLTRHNAKEYIIDWSR